MRRRLIEDAAFSRDGELVDDTDSSTFKHSGEVAAADVDDITVIKLKISTKRKLRSTVLNKRMSQHCL